LLLLLLLLLHKGVANINHNFFSVQQQETASGVSFLLERNKRTHNTLNDDDAIDNTFVSLSRRTRRNCNKQVSTTTGGKKINRKSVTGTNFECVLRSTKHTQKLASSFCDFFVASQAEGMRAPRAFFIVVTRTKKGLEFPFF
jgi:hypothetical protein